MVIYIDQMGHLQIGKRKENVMKVTQIRSFPVTDKEGRSYFIVRVDTDAGHHGLGEVGIRNWGKAVKNAIDHLSELVIGSDPWETEKLWQMMKRKQTRILSKAKAQMHYVHFRLAQIFTHNFSVF